jgi:hypothetical protein
MRPLTIRPAARLQPFAEITRRYGFTPSALDRLVSTGVLRVVRIPGVRSRLLDVRDVEAAVESWKG